MIKSLAQGFGFTTARELVSGQSEGRRKTSLSSKTSRIAQKMLRRVVAQELENAYYADPITFNSVNKNNQMIMSAGYQWEIDEDNKEDFMGFIDGLGKVGEDYTFDELLLYLLWARQIFGYAYLENVWNENETNIVDLTRLDPKQMDYARDATGNVVLGINQKPVGFMQTISTNSVGLNLAGLGDPVPKEYKGLIDKGDGQIFLLPNRIAQFKLYTGANGFDSYGLVEPAYKSILRKLNIEEARTNSIYARGTYPLVDYVGNEKVPATPQRLESALEIMKKMKHDRYFALPYYHRVEPIEAKESDMVDNTLKHLRENQSAAFGMPLAFATGAGEATNRATLNNQQQLLEFTLNDMVNRMLLDLEKYVFGPIAKLRKYKKTPKIVWNRIGTEDWDEQAERLFKWVQVGVFMPQEIRERVAKMEGLKISATPPAPPAQPAQEKQTQTPPQETKGSTKENGRRTI